MRTLLLWLPALILVGVSGYLQARLSAFRRDRPWSTTHFGPVVGGFTGLEWLKRDHYTDAGQRYWLPAVLSAFAAMVAFAAAFLATI